MNHDRTTDLRRLLDGAVRAGLAPGMVAGWKTAGEPLRVVAVGRARVEPYREATSPETRFDLASLTKPLVIGTLSILAMREPWFSDTTRVREILPETIGTPVGERSIRQLLTHTSGLPGWVPLYALANGETDRTLEAIMGLPLEAADTHVVYSCPNFILLGMILERITETRLDAMFAELVLEPVGCAGAIGFRPPSTLPIAGGAREPDTESRLLAELKMDADSIPATTTGQPDDGNSRFLGGVAGNAGLFGTVEGVLTLAEAYLGVGEFLGEDEISLATTDHTPDLEQSRGFGWQLANSPGCSAGSALDPSSFGHTGFTGTSLWLDPTRGTAMTLLANRVHPSHRPTDLHPLRRRFHALVVDQH